MVVVSKDGRRRIYIQKELLLVLAPEKVTEIDNKEPTKEREIRAKRKAKEDAHEYIEFVLNEVAREDEEPEPVYTPEEGETQKTRNTFNHQEESPRQQISQDRIRNLCVSPICP